MLNRRIIIGGAAALPAVVVASCGATPVAASTLSTDFAAVLAEAKRASAAHDGHEQREYLPAKARAEALYETLPHTTVVVGPSQLDGDVIWSTDKRESLAVARGIVRGVKEGRRYNRDYVRSARTLVAADLRRERERARIARDTGLTAALKQSNELADLHVDAMDAVAQHPVGTGADLAAKLAFMIENDMNDGRDWLEELHADARRIAKLEG